MTFQKLLIMLILWSSASSFKFGSFQNFRRFSVGKSMQSVSTLRGLLDNSIDISPSLDGKLLKKVLQRGDPKKGYPLTKDMVDVVWKIFSVDGMLLHSSSQMKDTAYNSSTFSFQIGANPREVIQGWEIGVKQMFEGEVASFTIHHDLAFGVNGVPGIVSPNATIITEIQLLKIAPSIVREYQSVGINESIKEDLLGKVYSGESPISSEVLKNQQVNETKAGDEIKFFDPEMHKLDPSQQVAGSGVDHTWEETPRSIEVDIPLPLRSEAWTKHNLQVEIKYVCISDELNVNNI